VFVEVRKNISSRECILSSQVGWLVFFDSGLMDA